MTETEARQFAETNFGKLPEIERRWNLIHAECVIQAVEELAETRRADIGRLRAMAWIHDIGKIESETDHAALGLKILEKTFTLDETDKDCILNHGSSGKPVSPEAKLFREADGISLFCPEAMLFRFWAEAKEGAGFDEILERAREQYGKYLKAYSGDESAIKLLKSKCSVFFEV